MWKEYFAYGYNNLALAAGQGATFVNGVIRIDSDADFEFEKVAYFATSGNILVRMREDASGRYFIRDAIDLRAIGSNFIGTPFILPRPARIPAGTTLTVELADSSSATNLIRLALHGGKIRAGMAPWDKRYRSAMPFPYTTQRQTIAANATTALRISIDNDAHFLVQKISGFSQGSCLIDVTDGSSDRSWFSTALHFNCVVGSGQFPNQLFANRFITRGSVIALSVTDLSGVANIVEIVLWGSKLYE